MKNWQELIKKIIVENSSLNKDGTSSITMQETRSGNCARTFGHMLSWDLRKGFPAVTTKKLMFNTVMGELLWFLSGSSRLSKLKEYSNLKEDKWTIWTDDLERWNEDTNDCVSDDLGEIYGPQWRNCGWECGDDGVDQIANLIASLKESPLDRRHIVTAWNPKDIANKSSALPPCHYAFQCYVTEAGELDLMWHQRSVDSFLGLPFNIASYAALAHILCRLTGYRLRYLKCTLGDTHLYEQHLEQAITILSREPKASPRLSMPIFNTLDELLTKTAEDFTLREYSHHGFLKGELTVGKTEQVT